MQKRQAIAQRSLARELGRSAAEPGSLAARIRAARNLRRRISWPGHQEIEIGLRVLSRKDTEEARAAAAAALKARGIDESKLTIELAERVGSEYSVQLLWRSLYESAAPDAPRLFATVEDFDNEVTLDELHILIDEYNDLRRSVDPEIEELPQQTWDEFLDAVKKKDATRLNSTASSMPRTWLLSMVSRLASCLGSTSSSTGSSSAALSEIPMGAPGADQDMDAS